MEGSWVSIAHAPRSEPTRSSPLRPLSSFGPRGPGSAGRFRKKRSVSMVFVGRWRIDSRDDCRGPLACRSTSGESRNHSRVLPPIETTCEPSRRCRKNKQSSPPSRPISLDRRLSLSRGTLTSRPPSTEERPMTLASWFSSLQHSRRRRTRAGARHNRSHASRRSASFQALEVRLPVVVEWGFSTASRRPSTQAPARSSASRSCVSGTPHPNRLHLRLRIRARLSRGPGQTRYILLVEATRRVIRCEGVKDDADDRQHERECTPE